MALRASSTRTGESSVTGGGQRVRWSNGQGGSIGVGDAGHLEEELEAANSLRCPHDLR